LPRHAFEGPDYRRLPAFGDIHNDVVARQARIGLMLVGVA
jgi:hypothetical protein